MISSLPIGKLNNLEQRVKALEDGGGGGGASNFLALTDTPSSYSGEALKVVRVNAGETALEFVTLAGGGDALTTDPLSQFAATTSLQLKGVISDETGSGSLVFATSPTLVTPVLGVATATTINKVAFTAPATGATLTMADGSTLTVSASATISNGTHSGTNTGDQTSIVGITGTKAQFDTAVTDGNFLYVGDITQYTDELAQDAVGAMVDTTLVYTDGTPLLSRAALTGAITASAGSNTTALGSFTKSQLDTAVSDGNVMFDGDSITNATATAWRVFYSDSGGVITELALGADGTFLKSNGASSAPTFATPAGSGDVSKVGTPVNNQIGVWTGDGTIKGDANLTYDGTSFNLATGKNFQIAGATILADAAGTTTLSNIDALDATTEATIEAAIDTLANLTSVQGRTITLADAGANAFFGWDDAASAYENLTQAEARTILGLGTAAYVATDLADLNEATIESAIDTLANLTSIQGRTITLADAGADAILGWDDSANAYQNLSASDARTAIGLVIGTDVLAFSAYDDATGAETTTGTSTAKYVSPDGLAGSDYGKRVVNILVSDPAGSAITTGDGKACFRVPSTMNGWNLVAVSGALSTVSSSGLPTFQIRRSRRTNATTRSDADMLSTKLSIDASEFDSVDATTAVVIDTANDDVNTGDMIYIDIDVAGTGAKGLVAELTFQLP